MLRFRSSPGFTLIELMLGITVLAILLALAIPAFNFAFQKQRLKGAAERLASEIQFARSEAIASNSNTSVRVKGGANWCIGLDSEAGESLPPDGCDCDANDCIVSGQERVVPASAYDGVSRPADELLVTFDGVRGLPVAVPPTDPTFFDGDSGDRVGVRVTRMGSVVVCSPSGTQKVPEYPDC